MHYSRGRAAGPAVRHGNSHATLKGGSAFHMTTILDRSGRAGLLNGLLPQSPPTLAKSVTAGLSMAMQQIKMSGVLPFLPVCNRLFVKYVALVVTLVSVALFANGALEIWFSYWAHKASLIRIGREQAEGAAASIGQFVKDIEAQLGWTVQLPWDSNATTPEQRRNDAWRLLRQVPAITELEQIDPAGRVQLRVSRTEPDEIGSAIDVSGEAKFRDAVAHTAWYGQIYFRQSRRSPWRRTGGPP
jgi:hypothetical protein